MVGEGDSGPCTQAVGLIKSLHSLVNLVRVSTPVSVEWQRCMFVQLQFTVCRIYGIQHIGFLVWQPIISYMPDHRTTDAQFTTVLRSPRNVMCAVSSLITFIVPHLVTRNFAVYLVSVSQEIQCFTTATLWASLVILWWWWWWWCRMGKWTKAVVKYIKADLPGSVFTWQRYTCRYCGIELTVLFLYN